MTTGELVVDKGGHSTQVESKEGCMGQKGREKVFPGFQSVVVPGAEGLIQMYVQLKNIGYLGEELFRKRGT